jgi:arylsulfatase
MTEACMTREPHYPGTLPWQFAGGVIKRVAVDVSGEPYVDLAREAKAMLVRE